jgi:hypothetical protein
MRSRPVGTKFFIDLPRNKETRDVLEALIQFKHAGDKSWNFPHGEFHKRTLARWLRNHRDGIISQLQPSNGLDTRTPITSAVQFLATTATLRLRKRLSYDDPVELINELLSDIWEEQPTAMSQDWKQLTEDMRIRHPLVKQFVVSELNVAQGRTGGRNFINTLPLIQEAGRYDGSIGIQLPGEDYHAEYWSSRFEIFERMTRYSNLLITLEKERAAIAETVDAIRMVLHAAQYGTRELPDALTSYCTDLVDLLNASKITHVYVPQDAAFEDLVKRKVFGERKGVWATALKNAQVVADGEDPMQVLLFDSKTLLEARESLAIATQHLARIERVVDEQLAFIEQEGDPDALKESMLQALKAIVDLTQA